MVIYYRGLFDVLPGPIFVLKRQIVCNMTLNCKSVMHLMQQKYFMPAGFFRLLLPEITTAFQYPA